MTSLILHGSTSESNNRRTHRDGFYDRNLEHHEKTPEDYIRDIYHCVQNINSKKVSKEYMGFMSGGDEPDLRIANMPFLDSKLTRETREPYRKNLVKRITLLPKEVRHRIVIERDSLNDYIMFVDGQQYKNGHRSR